MRHAPLSINGRDIFEKVTSDYHELHIGGSRLYLKFHAVRMIYFPRAAEMELEAINQVQPRASIPPKLR